MKRQMILMAALLFCTASAALTVKAHVGRQTTIYGKWGGQCSPLCSSAVNAVCVRTSDDALYYTNGTCGTRYTGANYALPSK